MPQQKIKFPDFGARAMRVLNAVTPINGTAAPAVNAKYLGQIYVDEVAKKGYMAVAVGSATPANDWKEITFVSGPN